MYTSSLAKYFFASDLAAKNSSSKFFSSKAIFIPLPPPPPAAFIKTGNPIFLQIFFASLMSETPASEPSITGKPYSLAIFLA